MTLFVVITLSAAGIFLLHVFSMRMRASRHQLQLEQMSRRMATAEQARDEARAQLVELEKQFEARRAADPSSWKNVGDRLRSAIDNNEFTLLAQRVAPMRAGLAPLRDVLVRMHEEEDNLIPPGTYLSLAEEHGMVPDLDRWVVGRLVKWLAEDRTRQSSVYEINISRSTLSQAGFEAFVAEQLGAHAVPASSICFQLPEADALALSRAGREAMERIEALGCRFTLVGFGGNPDAFSLLTRLPFAFVSLDPAIVLNVDTCERSALKVEAINNAAHKAGAATIADCVESRDVAMRLRTLGVDYAQGRLVAMPEPINEPWLEAA
jgi:EAL domain-containing protein (putative c-di-GMP-specific phosphodiesterase class I)